MESLTRDQVRERLKAANITCSNVTDEQLKKLRKLIVSHLRKSGIFNGTARIARANKDLKYISMNAFYFDKREAVSFNRDGFIGIAGWADNKNVQPLLNALIEWIEA